MCLQSGSHLFLLCDTLTSSFVYEIFRKHSGFHLCVLRFSEDIQVTSGAVDVTIQFVFALDLTMVHDSSLFTKSVQL
jgi:hypothetical protein